MIEASTPDRAGRRTMAASSEAWLDAILHQVPSGVLLAEVSGRVRLLNPQAVAIVGPEADGASLAELGRLFSPHNADDRGDTHWPLARSLTSGDVVVDEIVELERPDGSRSVLEISSSPVRDADGEIVAAIAIVDDVTDRRRAEDAQRFQVEASELLSASLDVTETVRRLADLAVPRIADWCLVDLVRQDGGLDLVAVAHVDPELVELARTLRQRYPPDPDSTGGAPYAIRTGRSQVVTSLSAAAIDAAARDEEHRRIYHELRPRSYMCVPLLAGGQTLGAMTFVAAESGRHYTEADLPIAEDLARRAAAALDNSRLFAEAAQFKQILDATIDAVVMFDPDTLQLAYVNRGAAEQLGYGVDELLGRSPTEIAPALDEARLRGIVGPLVAGVRESTSLLLTFRRRDDRPLPVDVLFQYIVLPSGAGRIVATARDITDRVDVQARLQRLAESEHARAAELNAVIRAMGEGVLVCAADGSVRLANPAADALFPEGHETYADLLADLEDPRNEAPRLGQAGGPVALRVRGGEERWLELSTYPVVGRADPGGATTAVPETIVLVRDVSEARQRQLVRDTFIHVLSHELRTPITTIYGGAKVLARGDRLDAHVRDELFADIQVEAERLHRLVEDVIALTRFGEDEGETGNEPLLLQRILPGVVASEEQRWPGVAFNLDMHGGLSTVSADRTYVEQVVRNLLSNAAKYAGQAGVVRIEAQQVESEVLVRILDDGPGFPAREADRLFELFYRSPSTARVAGGAGIGLFVCARLIDAMGGRIWARARPEGGAEFGFALQVLAAEE